MTSCSEREDLRAAFSLFCREAFRLAGEAENMCHELDFEARLPENWRKTIDLSNLQVAESEIECEFKKIEAKLSGHSPDSSPRKENSPAS